MQLMRKVPAERLTEAVRAIAVTANYDLPEDVMKALENARRTEVSPVGLEILDQIIENAKIAAADRVPICQDTGFAVIYLEIGTEVCIEGDPIAAINRGCGRGTRRDTCANRSSPIPCAAPTPGTTPRPP
jgi:fumarate hydratase subunit alpha